MRKKYSPYLKAVALAFILLTSTAEAGQLQLAGEATFRYLFLTVYDAQLSTADGHYSYGKTLPLELTLTYRHDIPAEKLVSETARQWQKSGLEHARSSDWLNQLGTVLPDVENGDSLTLYVDEGGTSHFSLNGTALGKIADTEFSRHFSGIWLCPCSTAPDFTARLTGADR